MPGAPNQPSTPPSNPSSGGTALPTIGGVPTVTETTQEPISFSGTSDASVTDTLLDNGTLSSRPSATTTADGSGNYSASITLADGAHLVTVQSFKTVNGVSVPSLQSSATTVDVAIPPVISSITGVDSASQTVGGTAPEAVDGTTTISLYDGGTLVASNIAVSGGAWSYTGNLGAGAHSPHGKGNDRHLNLRKFQHAQYDGRPRCPWSSRRSRSLEPIR